MPAVVGWALSQTPAYHLEARDGSPVLRVGALGEAYFSTTQIFRNATGLPWSWRNNPSFSGPSGL
jgi:hypothetical protein